MKRTTEERFWAFVLKTKMGCWLYRQSKTYGKFWDGRQHVQAHRYSFMNHKGKIPKGMFVCHSCDVPNCVNPKHLFLGTPKANMVDMMNKKRNVTCRGERNGKSKLTLEDVKRIRTLLATGTTQIVIAKLFGIHQTNVHYIGKMKTWQKD